MSTTERRDPSTSSARGWDDNKTVFPVTTPVTADAGASSAVAAHAPAAAPAASLPGAYWRTWSASLVSNLGDGINFVAMPLLALSLTDDARLLALTTSAVFLPWLLIGLPVGVAVDRFDRQRLMIWANVVRVALFGVVALGAVGGRLDISRLLALLLVIGCCEVLFDSSAQAFLPMVVGPDLLGRANGLLFAAEVVAGSIAGLSVGAALFDVDVGLPFAVNAASFAAAALLIASIRVRPTPSVASTPGSAGAHPGGGAQARFGVGLRWLWRDPVLRTLAMMFTVTNLGLMLGQGIFVKYAVDELGLTSAEFGILLAVTAMGAATGGLIGHRVMTTIGIRAAVVVPYLVFGAGNILIGVATSAALVAATGFVLGASITVWNVVTITVRQRLIPGDRFGRVNGVYRWLGAAASAVGVAAGGLVAHQWSVRAPFLVGGVISVSAAIVFARPVLTGLGGSPLAQPAIVPPPRTPAPPSIT